MKRVCQNCGRENDINAVKCSKCGEWFEDDYVGPKASEPDEAVGGVTSTENSIEEALTPDTDTCVLELSSNSSVRILVKDGQTVGRRDEDSESGPDCWVYGIPNDELGFISHLHAKFFKQADQWFVQNLSRTNYTVVNGRQFGPEQDGKMSDPVKIEDGDIIGLTFTKFRFRSGV